MEDRYLFRKAASDDVLEIFALIMRRVAWMDRVGIRQWNATNYAACYPLTYYEQRLQQEELFVLEDRFSGRIVCAGALFHADARWADPASAYYLHHFASDLDVKGTGSIFLKAAEDFTAAQGKQYLRLDSATDNPVLADYYTSRGYEAVGSCTDGLYEGILRQKKLL